MGHKWHFKSSMLKLNGTASDATEAWVIVGILFAFYFIFLVGLFTLGFYILHWALGIFGYHITGWQYIGGWVILGFLRTVISYLFIRE